MERERKEQGGRGREESAEKESYFNILNIYEEVIVNNSRICAHTYD